MSEATPSITWVVLTMGNRPAALSRAISSILTERSVVSSEVDDGSSNGEVTAVDVDVVVVSNGGGSLRLHEGCTGDERITVIELSENAGAPGGRDIAVGVVDADIVGFLDDDAELPSGASRRILEAFGAEAGLGAVTLRLLDEVGKTQRRHLPRIGERDPDLGGEVTLILEGASAIRRSAYLESGGYFTDLVYAHEAVELCWRLTDHGWKIRYLADVGVFHPRTPIARHARGWWYTGRNRVWIARRSLPWPVAIVHVLLWLFEGTRRAPSGTSRRAYLAGWWSGWSARIERKPIRWRTVWRLSRLGRPPIF